MSRVINFYAGSSWGLLTVVPRSDSDASAWCDEACVPEGFLWRWRNNRQRSNSERGSPQKENIMKNLNSILFGAAVAATLSLVTTAGAQYKATGDDGITASPKVRQMLNARPAATRIAVETPSVTVTYRNPAAGITASPKAQQLLAERRVVVSSSPAAEVASAGNRTTGGNDGIAASPKLRQQLDERTTSAPITIAPLK